MPLRFTVIIILQIEMIQNGGIYASSLGRYDKGSAESIVFYKHREALKTQIMPCMAKLIGYLVANRNSNSCSYRTRSP